METETGAPSFQIGTNERMNMALDEIIKEETKGKRRTRKIGKQGVPKKSSKSEYKKEVAATALRRAAAIRQNRVQAARGLKQKAQRQQVFRAPSRFLVRTTRRTGTAATHKDNTWFKQQRERLNNAKKKLRTELKGGGGGVFSIGAAPKVEGKNSITIQISNPKATARRPGLRQRGGGAARGINTAANRARTRGKVQQDRLVSTRRGIQPAEPKTLNERFGKQSTRGRGQTRPTRGSRGGRGRGARSIFARQ